MATKRIIEGTIGEICREDRGSALIADIYEPATDNDDTGVFIHLQSWDTSTQHEEWNSLGIRAGVKIKIEITIGD
jgi:hypothetical protein